MYNTVGTLRSVPIFFILKINDNWDINTSKFYHLCHKSCILFHIFGVIICI